MVDDSDSIVERDGLTVIVNGRQVQGWRKYVLGALGAGTAGALILGAVLLVVALVVGVLFMSACVALLAFL